MKVSIISKQDGDDKMKISELINKIDGYYIIDCNIVDNNTITGFYKTQVVKYTNVKQEEVSYLFPTTFKIIGGNVHTTMIFGSVARNFEVPYRLNGTGHGTELSAVRVNGHVYSLLIATQQYVEWGAIDIKSFICIIEALDIIGFPFMRIANNNSVILDETRMRINYSDENL